MDPSALNGPKLQLGLDKFVPPDPINLKVNGLGSIRVGKKSRIPPPLSSTVKM